MIEGFGVELISQYEEMFRTNNCAVIPQLIEDDFSFAPPSTSTTATTPGHWTSFVILSQHDKALSLDTYVPNSAQTIRLKVAKASPSQPTGHGPSTTHSPASPTPTGPSSEAASPSRFEDARESEFEFVDADFCAQGEVPMELDDDG